MSPDSAPSIGRPMWIWDAYHRETPNQLVIFQKNYDGCFTGGHLKVAARGTAQIYVNGVLVRRLHRHDLVPGAGAELIDLAPHLASKEQHPGQNPAPSATVTITVAVVGLAIGTHRQPWSSSGLWIHGVLKGSAGDHAVVASDATWSATIPSSWLPGTAQIFWANGYQENFDARHGSLEDYVAGEAGSWEWAVAYPDDCTPVVDRHDLIESPATGLIELSTGTTHWTGIFPATMDPAAWSRTETHQTEAHQLVELDMVSATLPVVRAVTSGEEPRSASFTGRFLRLDHPHQIVGFLEVEITTPAEAVIDVLLSETLDPAGAIFPTRQGVHQADRLTVSAGRTRHRFFNRRTWRHLQIVVRNSTSYVTVAARIILIGSNRQALATLQTADPQLDAIWEVSRRTSHIGRQHLYEDCPLREGAHYIADARLQALIEYRTTGHTHPALTSLKTFSRRQDTDGFLLSLTPSGTNHHIPDFNFQWVLMLQEYLAHSNDINSVNQLYDTLVRVAEWSITALDSTGMIVDLRRSGWWTFIDWDGPSGQALEVANAFLHALALQAAAAIAEELGRPEHSTRWRQIAIKIYAAANGILRREWVPGSEWMYAAVYAGLIDKKSIYMHRLAELPIEAICSRTGYFNFYLGQALINFGYRDAALALVKHFWGGMLKRGATTWWERDPEGFVPTDNVDVSLCHPWSCGPELLLPQILLGITMNHSTAELVHGDCSSQPCTGVTGSVFTADGLIELGTPNR